MASILCPYCFRKFSTSEAQYQCTNTETKFVKRAPSKKKVMQDVDDFTSSEMNFDSTSSQDDAREDSWERVCPKEKDEKFNNHWHHPGDFKIDHIFSHRGFFGGPPKSSKCNVCGADSSKFVCPHCHNWLPTEMIAEGSQIISVIGAQSSGKTTYITTLYKELQKYGHRMNLNIRPKDESPRSDFRTTDRIQRLMTRLYDEKQLLEKTPVGERPIPLIFKLTKSKYRDRPSKDDKQMYLVFYDTAGESFDNQEEILRTATYLQESSAVILLIDPFSIKALRRDILEAGYDESDFKNNPAQVMSSLLAYAESDLKRKQMLKKKPLAIAFSKIDAVVNGLKAAGSQYQIGGIDLQTNSSFLQTGKLDMAMTDQISEGLDTVCRENWDLGGLVSTVQTTFQETHFFGISSLGGDIQKLDAIHPYRVLDPLIWILSRLPGFEIPLE